MSLAFHFIEYIQKHVQGTDTSHGGYIQTGCSFDDNMANFHRKIDSLCPASWNLSEQVVTFNIEFAQANCQVPIPRKNHK